MVSAELLTWCIFLLELCTFNFIFVASYIVFTGVIVFNITAVVDNYVNSPLFHCIKAADVFA